METGTPYLVEWNPLVTIIDAYSTAQIDAWTAELTADWSVLAVTTQEISMDINIGSDVYNDLSVITTAYGTADIPRLTGIQFYESELFGLCMGFQLIYADISDTTFIYLDQSNAVCTTTDITLGSDTYITDVQVSSASIDSRYSLQVKFTTNGNDEYTCGVGDDNFVPLIPNDESTNNVLLYFSVGLADYQTALGE